ncbi:hypothetical protein, partial [Methanomethylophilus alvi]|uniref:hypothetical protein n=1 Tax=Methanomethylophilus alvi TaxID=1291540 RepID=UPI0037DDE2D1
LMDMVLYILSYNYINPRFIYPLYTVYKSEHVRKWSYEGVAQDSGISVEPKSDAGPPGLVIAIGQMCIPNVH